MLDAPLVVSRQATALAQWARTMYAVENGQSLPRLLVHAKMDECALQKKPCIRDLSGQQDLLVGRNGLTPSEMGISPDSSMMQF